MAHAQYLRAPAIPLVRQVIGRASPYRTRHRAPVRRNAASPRRAPRGPNGRRPPRHRGPARRPGPDSRRPAPSWRNAGYRVVFKDRPFALRAPSQAGYDNIDLDVPKAVPGAQLDESPYEITYNGVAGIGLEFHTPMGRAAGRTAQACLDGSRSDVLPDKVGREELDQAQTIHVGTVLCTQTTDGNLAMLEITGMSPNHESEMPNHATRLTLWKKS
ncbi:hypothetical protein [Streptomyces sp. CT34]|uniref:hypothetical protein n=1 Tax=Streptomyces sp. CT34 TaxID=1553907 RepID=UPI0005BDEEEA|nr:hypothetical protein [Streptomyces sp. CT34]